MMPTNGVNQFTETVVQCLSYKYCDLKDENLNNIRKEKWIICYRYLFDIFPIIDKHFTGWETKQKLLSTVEFYSNWWD
jgi:hypothetical protein